MRKQAPRRRESSSPPRLDPLGAATPVGPPDDQSSRQRRQARYGRRCRPRGRRCLLKGCGRWFQPRHPQARYCSDICRRAAKRWRDWKSKERYRKSERGREKRREQSRRHREREGERSRESFRCAVGGAAWVIAQPRIFMFLRPSVQRCYEIFSRTRRSPQRAFRDSAQGHVEELFIACWRGSVGGRHALVRGLGVWRRYSGSERDVLPRGERKPSLS